MKSRKKTKEQLKKELKKTKEEVAIQKWGVKKTLDGMKVLVKEITQRGREIEEVKAKDEALLESIGEGVIAVDVRGKILFVNHAFEELLGWKQDEVVGKPMMDVVLREDEMGNRVLFEESILSQVLAGKKVTTTTTTTTTTIPVFYFIKKNKTRFLVNIVVTPVIIDNKIIGAIEIFRDVTKEKEIDKAKTEFVSLASHQLRTPLTTISWYTEMILKGDVGQVIPSQKKYLEEIYQGDQRMIEMVNTLLDVSRLELGTFKIEPKPTDIIALAQSVLEEQKPKIENKKLIIIENFNKNVPVFSTDPKLLRMVFQNLLANSVEYTPDGGKIIFEISLSDIKSQISNILIKVSDTGYGIPKDQQNQIFTKLFRADNVRDKDTDGTGLGLYIVKSIVENSGGKIWFESEEDKGTTFYVTLPINI